MKPNTERLIKLADHLLNGKLGHEVFDFGRYNDVLEPKCGTAGCAIGECPIVWPIDWHFDYMGTPHYLTYEFASIGAQQFFDISHSQYEHLFEPRLQSPEKYGGDLLGASATKEQVANNILEFCKRYD